MLTKGILNNKTKIQIKFYFILFDFVLGEVQSE